MKKTLNAALPETVTDVRRRLDAWRKTPGKRGPIPAALWREAACLARTHGLNPIARALRLEYYSLKRQLAAVLAAGAAVQPAFVEVAVVPELARSPECAVELERPDGARMRVRVSRSEDLVVLAESLASSKSTGSLMAPDALLRSVAGCRDS